jgi:citrate synthase
LAQWIEHVKDPEQKIARPRQIYLGEDTRDFVPIEKRPKRVIDEQKFGICRL